mmetsp:Transcript_10891/g.15352  ORF Transcript_10891/g.15352 Transcript_10891/m.15352 type:complete len:523 (-) Transcript_10891:1587-3155(-)
MALVSDGYRPGDSRRAELRSKAKDKVDIDIPKSKSGKRVKIDRYYRAAEKLLDSFDDAYDARKLDDAYMLGKRFVSFSLEDLPQHPDYDSSRYDWQREENGKDIEYIFGRLKHINDLIDAEEIKNDPRSRAEKETEMRIKSQLNRRNSVKSAGYVDGYGKNVVGNGGRRASTGADMRETQRVHCSKYLDGRRRSSLEHSTNRRQVEPSSKDPLLSWSSHERYESEGKKCDRRSGLERTASSRSHKKRDSLDRHSSHEILRPDQMVLNIPNRRKNGNEVERDSLGSGSSHDRDASKHRSRSNRIDDRGRGAAGLEPDGQKVGTPRSDRHDNYNNIREEDVTDQLGRHSSHERFGRRRDVRELPQRTMKSRKSQSLRNVKEYHADERSQRSQGTWVGKDLRIKRRPSKTQEGVIDRNNSRTSENIEQDVRVYGSEGAPEPLTNREGIKTNVDSSNKSQNITSVKTRRKASMTEISEDCALVKFKDTGTHQPSMQAFPNTAQPGDDDADDGSYSISSKLSYPSID